MEYKDLIKVKKKEQEDERNKEEKKQNDGEVINEWNEREKEPKNEIGIKKKKERKQKKDNKGETIEI